MHASLHGWILLTSDKDFVGLHQAWQHWAAIWGVTPRPEHPGVLLFEQQRWSAAEAARQIDSLLQAGVSVRNTVYRWTPSRGWHQPT